MYSKKIERRESTTCDWSEITLGEIEGTFFIARKRCKQAITESIVFSSSTNSEPRDLVLNLCGDHARLVNIFLGSPRVEKDVVRKNGTISKLTHVKETLLVIADKMGLDVSHVKKQLFEHEQVVEKTTTTQLETEREGVILNATQLLETETTSTETETKTPETIPAQSEDSLIEPRARGYLKDLNLLHFFEDQGDMIMVWRLIENKEDNTFDKVYSFVINMGTKEIKSIFQVAEEKGIKLQNLDQSDESGTVRYSLISLEDLSRHFRGLLIKLFGIATTPDDRGILVRYLFVDDDGKILPVDCKSGFRDEQGVFFDFVQLPNGKRLRVYKKEVREVN